MLILDSKKQFVVRFAELLLATFSNSQANFVRNFSVYLTIWHATKCGMTYLAMPHVHTARQSSKQG